VERWTIQTRVNAGLQTLASATSSPSQCLVTASEERPFSGVSV
jgi:hypothetical protein